MIESIEGKRGLPRHRPPYVAQVGLFGRPTLVHNIETLYWIARICREGSEILSSVEKMVVRDYEVIQYPVGWKNRGSICCRPDQPSWI